MSLQCTFGTNQSQLTPTGDVVGRAINTTPSDGTSTIVISTASAALAENVASWLRTASALYAFDSAASVASKQVPCAVVSTALPHLKVALFGGTGQALVGSATNVAAKSSANALLAVAPGQWVVTHAPAVNVVAIASQASGGAGVRNVAQSVSGTVVADSTAPTAVILTLNLRDGATGAGTILATWTIGIEATAGRTTPFNYGPFNLPGTAATAMTLEFTAAGGAHTFESLTLAGTTCV